MNGKTFRMEMNVQSRHEQAAEYLAMTAYQRALEVQLDLLEESLQRFRGFPRQIIQDEIARVTADNEDAKDQIMLKALRYNFPLPPSYP